MLLMEEKEEKILIKFFQTTHNKNKVISRNRKINKNGNSKYSTQFSLIVSDDGSEFPENIDFRDTTSRVTTRKLPGGTARRKHRT